MSTASRAGGLDATALCPGALVKQVLVVVALLLHKGETWLRQSFHTTHLPRKRRCSTDGVHGQHGDLQLATRHRVEACAGSVRPVPTTRASRACCERSVAAWLASNACTGRGRRVPICRGKLSPSLKTLRRRRNDPWRRYLTLQVNPGEQGGADWRQRYAGKTGRCCTCSGTCRSSRVLAWWHGSTRMSRHRRFVPQQLERLRLTVATTAAVLAELFHLLGEVMRET